LVGVSFCQFVISSTCYFLNWLFQQFAILWNSNYINFFIFLTCLFHFLIFHLLVISSTCYFINWSFNKFVAFNILELITAVKILSYRPTGVVIQWRLSFRCSTPTCKHYTRWERSTRDKQASLLGTNINYIHRKFYNNGCSIQNL